MAHTVTNSAGASTGSLKTYFIGFLLSVVLTAFAFALVVKSASFPRWIASRRLAFFRLPLLLFNKVTISKDATNIEISD